MKDDHTLPPPNTRKTPQRNEWERMKWMALTTVTKVRAGKCCVWAALTKSPQAGCCKAQRFSSHSPGGWEFEVSAPPPDLRCARPCLRDILSPSSYKGPH